MAGVRSRSTVSLNAVLLSGGAGDRKLDNLRAVLEAALGSPLDAHPFTDAIEIRRRMVAHLRQRNASEGLVQAMEQLYMGVVRRAALTGLVAAPPEGPWSLSWQFVLDSHVAPGHRARLRQLAAWSTARGLEPADVQITDLTTWCNDLALPKLSAELALSALREWAERPALDADATSRRTERLRLKAAHGSVLLTHVPARKK